MCIYVFARQKKLSNDIKFVTELDADTYMCQQFLNDHDFTISFNSLAYIFCIYNEKYFLK